MPAPAPDSPRQGRSVLKLSLGVSLLAVATIIAVVFVVGAPEAEAGSVCTATSGPPPPYNWSDASKWTCFPGPSTYPGQNAGDTAQMCVHTFNVDVNVANGVILQMNCASGVVNIPAASALTIEPSSLLGSVGNTVNIGGGT